MFVMQEDGGGGKGGRGGGGVLKKQTKMNRKRGVKPICMFAL